MKVEQGREAVWNHAKETGMADDIARIAKIFDLADVSIISNGKMTYLHERPRKCTVCQQSRQKSTSKKQWQKLESRKSITKENSYHVALACSSNARYHCRRCYVRTCYVI